MIEFKLTEEYIELIRLLKYLRLAETGGHAKMMVDEGLVKHNGELEYRRRAKLRSGDTIEVKGETVQIK
jgi:ribosome-associated protein